jgi:hypothetical protein
MGNSARLAVGLYFELDAGRSQRYCDGEKMRDEQGFAAAQHHVRDIVADQLLRHGHGFVRVELVGQALAGGRLRAAMQAGQVAVARQLPGDEQRGPQLVDTPHALAPLQACRRMAAVNSDTATT